jgi:Arc/MetJ family transcription regulator
VSLPNHASSVRDVLYYVYKEVYNVRTNIVLDEAMVKKAFRYSGAKSKKELVHQALKEFIDARQRLDLRDLRGKVEFRAGYDYKKLRKGA